MNKPLMTFENLGELGQTILANLNCRENMTIYGLPGCGRSSVLNLIYDNYTRPGLQKILIGTEINKEQILQTIKDANDVLILIHFYERFASDDKTQIWLHALYREFRSKVQFCVSCSNSSISANKSFQPSVNIVLNKLVLIDTLPDNLILTIIYDRVGPLDKQLALRALDLSGRNPDLARFIAQALKDNPKATDDKLCNVPGIQSRLEDIFADSTESIILPKLAQVFKNRSKLSINSLDQTLTKYESDIYKLLLSNQQIFTTKEDMAKVLWGEQNENKYSEWAIYKLIHGLNKKLKLLSVPQHIKSTRSRGYQLKTI